MRFFCQIIVLGLLVSSASFAGDLKGTVRDDKDNPIPFVRIRLAEEGATPYSTTAFTAMDGSFALENVPHNGVVDAFRIGWKETARNVETSGDEKTLDIVMTAIDNVADQVPGSAWLKGDSQSMAYHLTTLVCSHCHQLGAARVRQFASKMKDMPVSDRSEAWLKRAVEDLSYDGTKGAWHEFGDEAPQHERIQAWEGMVQFMRWVTMRLGEENKLRWGLEEGSEFYNALLEPENSLFPPRDMEIVVPYLAHYFPVNFDHYADYDDIARLGDYGVTEDTVVEEYILPSFGWTREIAIAPGSPYIWFVVTDKDKLGRLNPIDGAVKWFDIEIEGVQGPHGPHTMNADPEGNLWIALEDSFHVARFNTKTEEWRMYSPPAGKAFGVTHDFAFNSDRHVVPDNQNRIWITDMGMNELWGIDVDTGDIETFQMPVTEGETNFHSLLYGAAIDTERNRVWWSQVYGLAGSFDTENDTVSRIIPLERGAGPRRLAIEDDGTLWIPLFGSGELVKFDSQRGEIVGRYPIPDRGATPYGVTLDKKRNAIWTATSSSDRIYRFDIEDKKWSHYPMPRQETFIRMIEVHPETGDVWTTYSSLPTGKRDPEIYGIEHANNIILRLIPGD